MPVRSWCRVCALLAAVWLPQPGLAALDEGAVKAAVAYNLILFTQWPGESDWVPGNVLQLCADPAGPWWTALRGLQDRPVRQWRLGVRETPRAAEVGRQCQVLLIDAATRAPVVQKGLMVVVDGVDGGEGGGWMLRLQRAGDRVVFDVDLAALRAARLQLSSKALRLAREVHE